MYVKKVLDAQIDAELLKAEKSQRAVKANRVITQTAETNKQSG